MTWNDVLKPSLASSELLQLKEWLKEERKTKNIYPPKDKVFEAYNFCPLEKTRVVIVGQDPYHTPGVSHGIAFSTKQPKRPPSLEIILKELYTDLNIQYFEDENFQHYFPTNDLTGWAQQGILLLNASLTVEQGKPLSHHGKGWEKVLKDTFRALNQQDRTIIILLWGKPARRLISAIDTDKHIVMEASHPAAEIYKDDGTGGFYGCKHFSRLQDMLQIIEGTNKQTYVDLLRFVDKKKVKERIKEIDPLRIDELVMQIKSKGFGVWLDDFRPPRINFSTNYSTNERKLEAITGKKETEPEDVPF